MSHSRIVVIEDEPDIGEVIRYNLDREGFDVVCAEDGEKGLSAVRESLPDLVVLDLMLPGIDGLEVCKRLKGDDRTRKVPIIMVTAKGEESDVVVGLEMGADDYLAKPFGPRELVARVRALLRRHLSGGTHEDSELEESIDIAGLRIDPTRFEVTLDEAPVELTATEFRLLHFMAARPGRVYTRERLVKEARGEDVVILDRNIDVHVRSIRKKLGENREFIRTVRGVGYRFRDAP